MESSCIAKSFYCWGCIEKGSNKTSDNIILSGRRNSTATAEKHPNPTVDIRESQLDLYSTADVNLVLEDYSYFETFTGVDPSCRVSMPSNYLHKHAKCYKNLRDHNSYLLVWFINDNQAYLEYASIESLGKLQISTGNYQETDQGGVNIEKNRGKIKKINHLTPFSNNDINVMTVNYDLFETYIGLDPFTRISSDPKATRTG
jgi:hypothetical protein